MSAKILEVKWTVNDGYVTGDRPQHTAISREEIRNCTTVEEAMKLIDDSIQESFEQEISWSYDRDDVEQEVKDIIEGNS